MKGTMTMKCAISVDDLLFHSVHGLCRVLAVNPQSSQLAETGFTLVPVSTNRANAKFMIPESLLISSGFSKLISTAEGNEILDYFKTGEKKDSRSGKTWELAIMIRTESRSKEFAKDGKKRQALDRAVKGICGELAYIYKLTVRDIADRIQKNLGTAATIHPLVLTALTNADKD